jgi:hypothetical protein
MIVKYLSQANSNSYQGQIESFIGREFPQLASGRIEDLVDAITEEIVGTKQVRLGPRPSPEALVKIRAAVRNASYHQRPLPILIAAASIKLPLGRRIDVAELSALKQLSCLQARVQRHYAPGISIRIRMEDLTELVISRNVGNIKSIIREYGDSFQALVEVLGYDKFIKLVPESSQADEVEYLRRAANLAYVFEKHLRDTEGQTQPERSAELAEAGWYGTLSYEQREYFKGRYRRLYPTMPESEFIPEMARYFAATLARTQMGLTGADASAGPRVDISLVPPQPDTPPHAARVYYRTAPLSNTSQHLAHWDAKGYLKINEQNQTRIALTHWWDTQEMYEGQLEITNDAGKKVILQADYKLE